MKINRTKFYCDRCGDEVDEGLELCHDCWFEESERDYGGFEKEQEGLLYG